MIIFNYENCDSSVWSGYDKTNKKKQTGNVGQRSNNRIHAEMMMEAKSERVGKHGNNRQRKNLGRRRGDTNL